MGRQPGIEHRLPGQFAVALLPETDEAEQLVVPVLLADPGVDAAEQAEGGIRRDSAIGPCVPSRAISCLALTCRARSAFQPRLRAVSIALRRTAKSSMPDSVRKLPEILGLPTIQSPGAQHLALRFHVELAGNTAATHQRPCLNQLICRKLL